MKKILFILFAPIFLVFACDEVRPVINPQMDIETNVLDLEVDVEDQTKHALIEEFTGVRCVNCPEGSVVLQNIIDTHGKEAVGLSIHAGDFSPPYNESAYDFRDTLWNSTKGIFDELGGTLGYPAAIINRVIHNGATVLPIGNEDAWPGVVDAELTQPLTVKIGLVHLYNPNTRLLEVGAKIFPQEDILEDDIRITVLLTESDIVDLQLTPAGIDEMYVHKHVLRTSISAFNGNLIAEPLLANSEIQKSFAFTIPDYWVAENCEIVAFVSKGGNDEVYQVVSDYVVE